MSKPAEQQVTKSLKQVSLEAGIRFRINTEKATINRWHYDDKLGIIVDDFNTKSYDVLEVNQYSVKVRASILGQVEAVWCRFETFIFDAV